MFCTLPGRQVQPHPRDQPDQPSCVTACQAHVHLPGPFQLQELRRQTKTRLAAPTSAVANHLVVVSHDRQARHSQGSKTKKANFLSTDRRVRRQKNLKLASGAPDRNPGVSPTPPAPSRGRQLRGHGIIRSELAWQIWHGKRLPCLNIKVTQGSMCKFYCVLCNMSGLDGPKGSEIPR